MLIFKLLLIIICGYLRERRGYPHRSPIRFLWQLLFMLSINDLKPGSLIELGGIPYQVLEVAHQHIGRGGSSIQTKVRHLKTGQVLSRNFKPADMFEEADVEKRPLKFIYHHRGDFVFCEPKTPQNRFVVKEETVVNDQRWLKPNTEVTGVFFNGELLTLLLPVKLDFEVTEAPPGIQGDRSSAGTKAATTETGAVVQVPLFINTGDIIRINTETGQYVERVKKA